MNRGVGCAVLLASAVACSSSSPPTVPSQPPPSQAPLQVQLALNGARLGSFSCSNGLFLAVSATNLSPRPLLLESLVVQFDPTLGSCQAYLQPLELAASTRIEAGQTAQLRRFDAAGQLCDAPYGAAECAWKATATLKTDAGAAWDAIGFETYRSRAGCEGVVPRLISPTAGAVISGIVDVQATLVESRECVNSARTIVEGFSDQGSRVFFSGELDLGDLFRWDTTRVPNGGYWITAFQNCCLTRSSPVVVTVNN